MEGTTTTIVASIVSSIVAIIATLIYVGGRPKLYQGGPPIQTVTERLPIINWFIVLYYFLPYGLFLFGVIYDGLVRKIKFFPAGFLGLLAVFLNSYASQLFGFGTTDTNMCGLPGMSKFGSDIAPQSIVFTSTVLSYIATYLTVRPSNSDPMSYGSAWIGVIAVWILQAIIFNKSGCLDPNRWVGGTTPVAPFLVPLLGLIIGVASGSLSGGLISKYIDSGSGVDASQQQSLLGGSKGPAMDPTSGTAGAGKCSPTDSDDSFVCEAYKNGELVTSTIVE